MSIARPRSGSWTARLGPSRLLAAAGAAVALLAAGQVGSGATEEADAAEDTLSPTESGPVEVDDTLLDFQWNLDRIRAREAWRFTRGSPDVVVAVIDTGVDPEHLDLDGALWSDPSTGTHGYDHVRGGSFPYFSPTMDWHGTAIAGVVGARANDSYGIAGVAPEIQVMSHRIYTSTSDSEPPTDANYPRAIRAMEMAVDAGADVLLLSWGGMDPSPDLLAAIGRLDVPVVAAAGNDGVDLSTDPELERYPAMYRHPNLVTVAASDQEGRLVRNDRVASNYGVRHVDLAAPGADIVSVAAGRAHNYFEGTSFAAPHVAAALALGRSYAPGVGTADLVGTLTRTVRPNARLVGRVTSGGELDVLNFLRALERPVCDGPLPPAGFEDVDPSGIHAHNIDCLVANGVALGTGPTTFDPGVAITREQMATFLVRVLRAAGEPLPEEPPRVFTDIDGSVHASAIDVLAELGIVAGLGDGRFAPRRTVTRAQMATFVVGTVQALAEPSIGTSGEWFDDIDGHTHEASIIIARELGITLGTGEPRRFQPEGQMRRDQMATFLARTLDALGRFGRTIEPLP